MKLGPVWLARVCRCLSSAVLVLAIALDLLLAAWEAVGVATEQEGRLHDASARVCRGRLHVVGEASHARVARRLSLGCDGPDVVVARVRSGMPHFWYPDGESRSVDGALPSACASASTLSIVGMSDRVPIAQSCP